MDRRHRSSVSLNGLLVKKAHWRLLFPDLMSWRRAAERRRWRVEVLMNLGYFGFLALLGRSGKDPATSSLVLSLLCELFPVHLAYPKASQKARSMNGLCIGDFADFCS